ncbi:MAG: acyl-CoA thioesterase [Rhodospirillaceae bacterium]|nr:acyl-CoA thioesterase [Rhodospirillaceae bacterium]MBL6941777.1 acyl-CoA thioesterase [Rhodospirillales bacterium]
MTTEQSLARADYPHIVSVPTRWADNDIYGHVNNVTYYAYFDTVVNNYLIEHGGLDIVNAPVIGVAVETMCRFSESVAYPETLELGLKVAKLGQTSVRYELAVFRLAGEVAVASGHFVHVFVNRATNKSTPIPAAIRTALERLMENE